MDIPVENKSRAKKVPVNIEKKEDPSLYYKNLAEELASLPPSELRKVVRAAKHLRKFVTILNEDGGED